MRAAVFLVQLYRNIFSSSMLPSCRFFPSCSSYAEEALQKHGARRGIWLTLKRLLRCQPFARAGWDPVP